MALSPGTKLGPYEILSTVGAGGMGEVYRARDERLKRDVAVKVLPATYSADGERLRRFEQEAQAAGALNHPNITAVHDFGTSSDGSPYIVTELLEGETLRGRLSGGALSVRKATDYAIQAAKGLAAAHEKGIVHRDLKPENLFVTNDGRIKILDFGLAKLTQADGATGPQTNLPTAAGTEPGVVMGTLGYMSPEQVKGKAADARSDIFSFGAILYEMLSGSRAFHRDTAAETMSAILREEPPDLSATNKSVQPGLERVVRHCLEKSPEERFHSAHDLAFDLESLSGTSSTAVSATASKAWKIRPLPAAAVALAIAAALGGGILIGRSGRSSEPAKFKQLTFRRGTIWSARFGADGKTILSSAAWDGRPSEVYMSTGEAPESRPFGALGADVAAVSPSGDVALLLNARSDGAFARIGTLARVSAAGGVPRELFEKVQYADFSRDGKDLAIVRRVEGKSRLEFPPGKVLLETAGWIGHPRFSPKGDRIAFLDHPVINDDGGTVAVVDLAGKKTTLSEGYATIAGLAWSPEGSEVWYTAAEVGGNRALHAVRASGGRTRNLASIAGSLTLWDVALDGRALVTHDSVNVGLVGRAAGAAAEIDLSWFDWTLLSDISDDGRLVLFSETGEGGGAGYSTYLRGMDGSPALRIGEGGGYELSPDGKSVLALVGPPVKREIVIYPTGPGETRRISTGSLQVRGLRWLDGRSVLAGGRETDRPPRVFLFDLESGAHRAVTPEGYRAVGMALGGGKRLITLGPDDNYYFSSIEGGEPVRIPGLDPPDVVADWADDGRIYVQKPTPGEAVMRLVTHDPVTGRQEPWRDLAPRDTTGVNSVRNFRLTRDGSYAYCYYRTLSTLFLVKGAK